VDLTFGAQGSTLAETGFEAAYNIEPGGFAVERGALRLVTNPGDMFGQYEMGVCPQRNYTTSGAIRVYSMRMASPDVTLILDAAARGDPGAAGQLLPLVYDELRKLAAQRMAAEAPGHTLQPTALVHEAYLRLVDVENPQQWNGRGHFFAAAAEAMRRILVERARRGRRLRHGGGRRRVEMDQLDSLQIQLDPSDGADGVAEAAEDLLALDGALARLEAEEPAAAGVVKLRYFAGLSIEQAATALGISVRTANRHWSYAKAWLYQQLNDPDDAGR
jgi:RNA polymerase sigma factor (TIGR02999 family)